MVKVKVKVRVNNKEEMMRTMRPRTVMRKAKKPTTGRELSTRQSEEATATVIESLA